MPKKRLYDRIFILNPNLKYDMNGDIYDKAIDIFMNIPSSNTSVNDIIARICTEYDTDYSNEDFVIDAAIFEFLNSDSSVTIINDICRKIYLEEK